jgi:type II secretory pathway pseudopilin PulG
VTSRRDAGYSMAALLAMIAVMMFALMLALPSWRYISRDDKEQELIFRGRQISAAIARFQRKNGNALPTSFDQLVQGKYLRKAYKDPMTADGKWRIVRPGEGARPGGPLGGLGNQGRPTPTPSPAPTPVFGGNSGGTDGIGPMAGVASLSRETSIRLVNGTSTYNLWVFAPNIPFNIGGPAGLPVGPPRAPNQAPPQGAGLRNPDLERSRVSR